MRTLVMAIVYGSYVAIGAAAVWSLYVLVRTAWRKRR